MEFQLRSMNETDTLPKRGRVNEVCREWLVHEDSALAYQLQKQEVERHLTGNKSRNAIVREDFPKAKDEQKREELEARAKYHEAIHLQEVKDARVAQMLAEEMAKEEERKRRLEAEDQRIARRIQQERERRRQELRPTYNIGDINSVGLPLPEAVPEFPRTELPQQFRMLSLEETGWEESSLPSPSWPPPPSSIELDLALKTEQEKRDEELARQLQEEEENGIDMVTRDRLMAIEAQDKELAKMLQEKEKMRAKRARERAKAKALAKKQMEEEMARNGAIICDEMNQNPRLKPKHRSSDGEEIEVIGSTVVSPSGTVMPNIAMAIDPTYTPPRSASSTLASTSTSYTEYDEDDEGPAPPYMPVQGQRRSSSLEKKKRKDKSKDGCKQQ